HDDRSPLREIKAIQQAPTVVNQRLAVLGPVRCLKRLGRTVHDRTVPARDIEDLQIAPDVVLVRHEPFARRCGDPYVAERDALDPHVRTRPRDRVATPPGVVGDRAPLGHLAYVGITLENTQGGLLSGRDCDQRKGHRRSEQVRGAIHTPVLPNPPPPRALGGSSATSSSSTTSTRWNTSCAMRVPRVTTTGSVPRLIIGIISSPR